MLFCWFIWFRTPPLLITDQEHCLIFNNNKKCLCRQLERLLVFQNYLQISGPVSWTCGSSISSRRPSPGMSSVLRIRIRDPVPYPGSGIQNRFFPDPGSQTHIFDLILSVLAKKLLTILWYLRIQKLVLPPLLVLLLDPGSEIRGPG